MTVRSRLIFVLSTILAACILAGGVLVLRAFETPPAPTETATATPIGGAFTLMDETGKTVTNETYKTPYKLLFFGFTHCPSICPTELLKMADVLTGLGDRANKITPLFISIDPARDTPSELAAYTNHFDDRIIGLTGTQDQIDAVVRAFKAYAARVNTENGDYTMDHSGFMYLTDHDNHLIKLYRLDDSADTILADLKRRL
jgi:protein SCO1/2